MEDVSRAAQDENCLSLPGCKVNMELTLQGMLQIETAQVCTPQNINGE